MKMYISKYALSGGIKEVWGNESDVSNKKYISVTETPLSYFTQQYVVGKDIHHTRAEAVAAAETLRAKKIAAIKRQLAKLEKMEF